jgi:hypothetical protein
MRFPAANLILFFTVIFTHAQDAFYAPEEKEYYFDIQTISDSTGIPDTYKVYVKTPICEDANCYVVEINFYYDLIGRYITFDTIEGKGLTKLDHIAFSPGDYQKLDLLLKDPNSPIGTYQMEELVKDTRSSEIDGLTGATVEEVKEIVISGGVYSCYTLWHIAQGALKNSLQQKTTSLLNGSLVKKMTDAHDQDVNYFLVNSFTKDQFVEYLPYILKTFQQAEGYYLKHVIEEMPDIVVNDSLVQSYFAPEFQSLNYFTQVALVKKLDRCTLNAQMRGALYSVLENRNSLKNELIWKLLIGKDL